MATSKDEHSRYTIDDVRGLQEDLARMDSDLFRRAHLVQEYPHIPTNFWKRRLTPTQLMQMDPELAMRTLLYADPTGEHALIHADGAGECPKCGEERAA